MTSNLVLNSLSKSFIGLRKISMTLKDFRTGSSLSASRVRIFREVGGANFSSPFFSGGTRDTKFNSSSTIPTNRKIQRYHDLDHR